MNDPPAVSPSVVVFTGLPGTGKSTMADLLATRMAAPSFDGDWLLGALAPTKVLNGVPRPTVHEAVRRAAGHLDDPPAQARPVRGARLPARRRGCGTVGSADAAAGGRLSLVVCTYSDEALHRSRIEGRVRGIPGWHEIGWDHVQFMQAEYPALTAPHLTLDAVDSIEHNLDTVLTYLRRPTP